MDEFKNGIFCDCMMDRMPCNHGSKMDQYPIAMAYVPWQKWNGINDDLEEAFCEGTIFPELNKPFTGRRCVK